MCIFTIQRCSVHIRICFVSDIADTPATAVTFSNDAGPDPMSGHVTVVQDRIYSRYNTRMATLKLDPPFRQSCPGQKTISYLVPNTWNNLAAETKLRRSVNTFKHDIKKLFFDKLKKQNDDIFFSDEIMEGSDEIMESKIE